MSYNRIGLNLGDYLGVLNPSPPPLRRPPYIPPQTVTSPNSATAGTLGAAPIKFIDTPLHTCGEYSILIDDIDSAWYGGSDYDPSHPQNTLGINVRFLPTDYKPVGVTDMDGVTHYHNNFVAQPDEVVRRNFFTDPESEYLLRGYSSGDFTYVAVSVSDRSLTEIPINGGVVKIHHDPPIGRIVKGRWREFCLFVTARTDNNGCLFIEIRQDTCDPLP